MTAMSVTGEHPHDVLSRVQSWHAAGTPTALVVITQTLGGAVRAPGALLAVSEHDHIGYISGGCIDADVILQARQALQDGHAKSLRYGAGSPFVDLPLPCGGAIDVLILPQPDACTIAEACERLTARSPVTLIYDADGAVAVRQKHARSKSAGLAFTYTPKLRLRIAGRGADALALAQIAQASGYEIKLQLIDEDDLKAAAMAGLSTVEPLIAKSALPIAEDDAWTAFILLFHDQDWEIPLLRQALEGDAFYVGAVGSRRTHAKRCAALAAAGVASALIDRIHGPIGIVPALRDASPLAISILAEIIDVAARQQADIAARTAFVLLAAGSSQRFEAGDKLLASYKERPVLDHISERLTKRFPAALKLAIIGDDHDERRRVLAQNGWEIVTNTNARHGQSTSLTAAIAHLKAASNIDQIVILLGDMPDVPIEHIERLLERARDADVDAIMTDADGQLSPPALFKRTCFEDFDRLSGDRGAKAIFVKLNDRGRTISLPAHQAIDIDRVADLTRALEAEHA